MQQAVKSLEQLKEMVSRLWRFSDDQQRLLARLA